MSVNKQLSFKVTSRNLWLLLVPSGILAVGGNFHLFFLTSFSYLGDILSIRKADQKTRTLVFLIAEGCAAAGAPIGLFLGTLFLQAVLRYRYYYYYIENAKNGNHLASNVKNFRWK